MPQFSSEVANFMRRVKDGLLYGQDRPARASLTVGSVVRLVAKNPGVDGNDITVEFSVTAGANPLSVAVTSNAIDVNLATDGSDALINASNTGTLIANAINASSAAAALVTAYPVGTGAGFPTAVMAATALAGGADKVGVGDPVAVRFLTGQDLASVLELMQERVSQPTALTATGGTSTTLSDTGAFVANTQVGNYVTFGASTTTTALRSKTYRVISNTANTLTFASLDGTPVAGDTYTISGGFLADHIAEFREGTTRAGHPRGSVYPDSRLVADALVRVIRQLGATLAENSVFSGTTASGSTTTVVALNLRGGSLRPGELRGMKCAVTGIGTRLITDNDEDSVTVAPALGSAPAGGTAVAITSPRDSVEARDNLVPHPGLRGGEALELVNMIEQAEAAVVAFALPT